MISRVPSAGVPGISNAVTAGGLVFISGQTAGAMQLGSFGDQVEGSFMNLSAVLREREIPSRQIVRLNLYATALANRDLNLIRTIRDRWIDAEHPPASTLIGVDALALPHLEFEVDAVCVA